MAVANTSHGRTGRRRLLWWGGIAVAAMALAWVAGFALFLRAIPLTRTDAVSVTDAIVVLTGGSKRLQAGLALLTGGRAEYMFISGVHRNVSLSDLLATLPPVSADVRSRIRVGHGAANTVGNAEETAKWMQRNGFRSLRLVTAGYHMPRSLLEFERTLPEATIIPHPVFPDAVRLERWWLWRGTAALLFTEYNKLLYAWTRHRITA